MNVDVYCIGVSNGRLLLIVTKTLAKLPPIFELLGGMEKHKVLLLLREQRLFFKQAKEFQGRCNAWNRYRCNVFEERRELELGFRVFMEESGQSSSLPNLAFAAGVIQTWARQQGVREESVSRIVKSLDRAHLLALPRPRTWNRKGSFGVQEHARYLWYRHTARTLGWQERRKFPEFIGAILKQVVFPEAEAIDGAKEATTSEGQGSNAKVSTSISAATTDQQTDGRTKSISRGEHPPNGPRRGTIANNSTVCEEEGEAPCVGRDVESRGPIAACGGTRTWSGSNERCYLGEREEQPRKKRKGNIKEGLEGQLVQTRNSSDNSLSTNDQVPQGSRHIDT